MIQVDWSKGPADATHYEPAVCTPDTSTTQEFFKIDGVCVQQARWSNNRWTWEGVTISDARRGYLIKRPVVDWSKGPADATHWGAGCEQWLEAFYKFDGVDTYYVARADLTRHWVQLDTPLPADRIAQLLVRPDLIDWSKAPERTTHARLALGDVVLWRMLSATGKWFAFSEGEWHLMAQETVAPELYVERPREDFSGPVLDFGPRSDAPQWDGQGLPPVGTHCVVTPHNSQWGFFTLGDYQCTVIAYYADYVWIDLDEQLPNVLGPKHLLTRTDKVDFAPIRTAEQAAAEIRVKAAQEWLKGIERDYGQEVADKCEDILMEAESRKQVAQ